MRLTQVKGLFYPVELYYTLPGSLTILKHITDTDKRSITQEAIKLEKWIRENYKSDFSFLKELDIPVPFVILETSVSFLARPYLDAGGSDKVLPLREDGFESGNVKHARIVTRLTPRSSEWQERK